MVEGISRSKDNPNDPRNQEVVYPAGGDPQRGNLQTPINASGISKWYINNLPAYRKGITPLRRGLEIGMAHGYWLIGPFAKLGPLRDTDIANLAGLIATFGLVTVMTVTLSLYASTNPPKPVGTVTVPQPPDAFQSPEGWNTVTSGFLIGGLGGATFAYFVLANVELIQKLFTSLS